METITADVVEHFFGRGHKGKAMMICIDKATAVKMYDKVQIHWHAKLANLMDQLSRASDEERDRLVTLIEEMETTDMAVVVFAVSERDRRSEKEGRRHLASPAPDG